jgi:UDP-N-acetyl-D-mannosaminuronic acid dehydrogenase
MNFEADVVIVGGCGRAGLPLGLAFAERGLSVVLVDRNEAAVQTVNGGKMPFSEAGADKLLPSLVKDGRIRATKDPEAVSTAENIVVVIGTPIDEHFNPDFEAVSSAIEALADHLRAGQLLVLRSTVYPGVTALVEDFVQEEHGVELDVSFCPERIAEGRALIELFELPQIVSGRTDRAVERASKLFRNLTSEIVYLTPEEAELSKLFTNAWRYIKFAVANQFFMIANDFDLQFDKIREALAYGYPRAADLPKAGFAAGPCLLKDTAQLAAFNSNNFPLGQASITINEGLPLYLVSKLEQEFRLSEKVVGILGMAFKAESDDIRSSLSYKLKRIMKFKSKGVLCHDPWVKTDPDLKPLAKVLADADILIIGAPHREYRELRAGVPVVDIWGITDAQPA